MAIADDTSIDYTNQIIDLTGTTVYDVSVLYSFCKEQFKLSANIDDDFAWTPNTPTDFTLKNGWILRLHSIRRLKNGGIKTVYGTDIIGQYEVSGGTNFVEGDIGKTVRNSTQAVNFGTLVDFDNTSGRILVRLSSGQHDAANSDVLEVTTDGGTGTRTSNGIEAFGDDQWTNIATIGDLVGGNTNPLMYVFTGDLATGDNNGNARKNTGREDDPDESLTNFDRGTIDVLIRIIYAGTTLGNPAGEIRVYARTGLDNYSDFGIDISAGGRISVPISNSNDVEDTIGDYAFAYDGGTAGDFTVGEEITENSTPPTWKAEVVRDIEAGTTTTVGILVVRGLTALPSDNDAFTGTTSGETGSVRGTAGGQFFAYDAGSLEIDEADYGNLLTSGGASGWTGNLRGHFTKAEGAGGITGYAVVETRHDVKANSTDYVLLGDNETITGTGVDIVSDTNTDYTRLCSDLDDVRVKAAFQRLTGITSGDAARGDNITQAVSGAKGTITEVVSGTEIHVSNNNGTVFDTTNTITDDDGGSLSGTPTTAPRDETFTFAHPLQSAFNYVVMIDGAARVNAEIFHYIKYFQQANSSSTFPSSTDQAKELYLLKEELGAGGLISQLQQGEEYFRAFTDEDTPANSFTSQEAKSRLAVKNGATIVTGQGVALINVASADANNITLTDTANVLHSPEVSVSLAITNTVSGDHVEVALDDGTGQEDKTQVASGAGNALGDTTLVLNAALPNDTPVGSPDEGVCKMVDDSSVSPENKEMRYRYTSFSSATLTLATGDTGTAEAASSGNTLVDTAAFGNTKVGDPIRNITDGSIAWVKEKVDANTVKTTQLEGGTSNDWVTGDTWETNRLVVAYVQATDQGYIPYMDRVADATSETETLTFVSNRNVVLRVRNTSIDDFDTTGTITNTGLSVKAVRNTDSVYVPT